MTTEIIQPRDQQHWLQLRTQDVTSTESAALFGMSPYVTHFDLWHRKKSGQVPEFKQNERMKWGNRLEAAIAEGIAEEMGWKVEPLKTYWRDPDLRLGSSFDYLITQGAGDEPAHLEIKNVDYLAFRDGWLEHDDGTIEAPEHIEMQVQHQMAVSGLKRAYIGAFIAGNRFQIIERERDEDVIRAICARVDEFWLTVDAGQEPAPVMPDDADAVIRLSARSERDKAIDASSDAELTSLVSAYKQTSELAGDYDTALKVLKAQILRKIGDAEKVVVQGFKLSAGTVGPVVVPETTRSAYRNLRITTTKEAK